MPLALELKCQNLIEELGLGHASEVREVTVLTGGVASDIASVVVRDDRYCVKFALPKLKVTADWNAPVHRNAAEYAWLDVAAKIMPQSAVRLYGRSDVLHGFAMEFVAGDTVYLWKSVLLDGQALQGEAQAVGDMLGHIHAASTTTGFDKKHFQNRDDFRALRIEPYLTFTAEAHPALESVLNDLADMLYGNSDVLVHGDVSPKNILIRDGSPIILDAECATMGDASFDLAFCLNHLVLKSVHIPALRTPLLCAVGVLWKTYCAHITWETPASLESRIARLIPALMLARIDGKSPVEYFDETQREQVRRLAIPLIKHPADSLSDFVGKIVIGLKELSA